MPWPCTSALLRSPRCQYLVRLVPSIGVTVTNRPCSVLSFSPQSHSAQTTQTLLRTGTLTAYYCVGSIAYYSVVITSCSASCSRFFFHPGSFSIPCMHEFFALNSPAAAIVALFFRRPTPPTSSCIPTPAAMIPLVPSPIRPRRRHCHLSSVGPDASASATRLILDSTQGYRVTPN